MSRTTNPNEQQNIELIDMTSTRLHSLDEEGEHFKELWRFLNTIGRFRALTPDDQVLLFRLTLTASDGATRNGYQTYIRAVLQSLEVLNRFAGEHSGVRAIFSESSFYESVGVWDTTPHKRNSRIAAVKKYLEAAVDLGLTDVNHLGHMKTRKIKRTPTPASEEAVEGAIKGVIDLIDSRVGWWAIIAFRALVLLDWKSYGLRSMEMAPMTRDDFWSNPEGVPVRHSKSEEGKSIVVLSEISRQLTAAYLKLLDDYREAKERPALSGSDPLFMGMRGEGLSGAAISSAVSKLLPDNVRPHDLRARMGTIMSRLRPSTPDVAAALRIQPGSVGAYTAAGDATGISADVAEHHAFAGRSEEIQERLGIVIEEPGSPGHDSSSGSESPCWLPDWFDADDEPDAA